MKFIVILTCVAINRYWVGSHPMHTEEWFGALRRYLGAHLLSRSTYQHIQFVIVVLVPVLSVALLLWVIEDLLWGIAWMAIGFIVLGYSIGISLLDEAVRDHTRWLRRLAPEDDVEVARSQHQLTMQRMVHEEFSCIYPILFWFVLAGPAGALLYRLSQQYALSVTDSDSDSDKDMVNFLIHTMDWIPVRITGLAFCVVGDFSRCIGVVAETMMNWQQAARIILERMTTEAIVEIEIEPIDTVNFAARAEYELKEVSDLLHRSLLFWIALIAVVTLLGWV